MPSFARRAPSAEPRCCSLASSRRNRITRLAPSNVRRASTRNTRPLSSSRPSDARLYHRHLDRFVGWNCRRSDLVQRPLFGDSDTDGNQEIGAAGLFTFQQSKPTYSIHTRHGIVGRRCVRAPDIAAGALSFWPRTALVIPGDVDVMTPQAHNKIRGDHR